jgi:hypothetical protein
MFDRLVRHSLNNCRAPGGREQCETFGERIVPGLTDASAACPACWLPESARKAPGNALELARQLRFGIGTVIVAAGCSPWRDSFRLEALDSGHFSGGLTLGCLVVQIVPIMRDEKLKRATADSAEQFAGGQDEASRKYPSTRSICSA